MRLQTGNTWMGTRARDTLVMEGSGGMRGYMGEKGARWDEARESLGDKETADQML